MNSTKLRALWIKHATLSAFCIVGVLLLSYCTVLGYLAKSPPMMLAALFGAVLALLNTFDNLSAFFRFRTLYRIQADEERRWIR